MRKGRFREGKFIVLEGITSSGKTTIGKRLAAEFFARGRSVQFNEEPTPQPFGKLIRSIIEHRIDWAAVEAIKKSDTLKYLSRPVELMVLSLLGSLGNIELRERDRQFLFVLNRFEDLLENVRPALEAGVNIIQSRYELSTFAFGKTRDIPPSELMELQAEVLGGVYRFPDLTVFVDVPPEVAYERLKAAGKTVDMYETTSQMAKTREAYLGLIGSFRTRAGYGNIAVVDGRPSLEEVYAEVKKKVESLIIPRR